MTEPAHLWTALVGFAEADQGRPSLTVDTGGQAEATTIGRGELLTGAGRLAARLAALGVTPGDAVVISLPNSVEFVQALLATWLLGAVPHPVSPRLATPELAAIIGLADPAVLVAAVPAATNRGALLTPEAMAEAAADPGLDPPPSPVISPIWKVVTSGGSSGRPKLIAATARAHLGTIEPLIELFRIPREGCVLVPAPLSHNAPLIITALGLLAGNHVVLTHRFDAARTLALAERHRASFLYLVPTMMQRIWRLPEAQRLGADLSALRTMYHMAAPCPPWLKRGYLDWLGPEKVMELYAGSELQAMTTISGTEWLAHPGSVGKAQLGEICCRRPDGQPSPPGEVGEIWLRRGPGHPAPYRYIGATPKIAPDGWESLGDLGYLDHDGYLYLTDRDTDMIIVGGSNVYPAEIEAALDAHPAVLTSCVIGLPDADLGAVPHALVHTQYAVTDQELLEHLRGLIAAYKLPRHIERVDHPLRDDAGKVRRTALRAERLGRA